MIKILSIGNSFSQDAQRYLHQIAENEGKDLLCVNLYIGGCSLETHSRNLHENTAAYSLEKNGQATGQFVGISQALTAERWDYVTLQQVSSLSAKWETYLPYLSELAKEVREKAPQAKIYIHQTWAYEQGSARLHQELGFTDQHEMLALAKENYKRAAETIHADGIIPSGDAMMNAIDAGVAKVHRDTFHASLGLGRYLLGVTWYLTLVGQISETNIPPLDEPVCEQELRLARDAAGKAVSEIVRKE